jgi:outer membrane protein OmpA-like peptidoglycan-associated protein
MKLRSALLAATVLAAPVAAKAEAVNGLYIGAGVGANFLQNSTINGIAFPQINNTVVNPGVFGGNRVNFDTGIVALGSIGYGLGNGLRVELEGNYRRNRLAGLGISRGSTFNNNFTATPGTGVHGDEDKYGALVNVLYDFDPNVFGLSAIPFPITPYVGLGAGYEQVKLQNASFYGPNYLFRTTSGQGSFAYQAIVGAAFPLGFAVPGLSLTLEYRFLGLASNRTFHTQFFGPDTVTGRAFTTRADIRFSDNYNHSVLLGVRYAFNEAPPPPPPVQPAPAPVAQPTRTYLVFFDWDRADLTPRARQIISEAAQATQRVQVTRIEVNGYTDLSGTARYNQGLSVRRANAVAAELVRDGVARNEIVARGFGESDPLVPTAQGVREPQNRRVEIILR